MYKTNKMGLMYISYMYRTLAAVAARKPSVLYGIAAIRFHYDIDVVCLYQYNLYVESMYSDDTNFVLFQLSSSK